MRLLAALALSVLCVQACGGSASETPFPEEPLPDYVTQRQKGAPAASASAKPAGADSGKASSAQGSAGVQATIPGPKPAPASDPAKPTGGAPAF